MVAIAVEATKVRLGMLILYAPLRVFLLNPNLNDDNSIPKTG